VQIRILTAQDAPAYRDLRLRALHEHPAAFATSVEEARQRPLEEVVNALVPGPEHVTFGAFHGERLVGIATLVRAGKAKLRHRATLTAMYVAPDARGSGLGRELLRRAVDAARAWTGLTDLALAVTVGNPVARALYADAGFVTYGIDPRSLRVEGLFHDVELMILKLDPGA
jgi:GNAT superfamily N-acetyltransferase